MINIYVSFYGETAMMLWISRTGIFVCEICAKRKAMRDPREYLNVISGFVLDQDILSLSTGFEREREISF